MYPDFSISTLLPLNSLKTFLLLLSRVISEFSLEYRTTRERVIQTIAKKKEARARKRMEKQRAAEEEAIRAARAALKSTAKENGQGEGTGEGVNTIGWLYKCTKDIIRNIKQTSHQSLISHYVNHS